MHVEVGDPTDERLAAYVSLTDADLRRAADERGGICIAEGATVIRTLLGHGHPLHSVLVSPSKLAALRDVLTDDVAVYVASPDVLNAVVGFDLHRGAVAVAVRPPQRAPEDLLRTARYVALLEGITDVENMGALFRNAAAFGIDAVVLSPTCCDPLYRRSLRVSMGHALTLPFAVLEPWPAGIEGVRAAGHTVVAMTPDPSVEPIGVLDPAPPLAVLLGTEGPGLTAGALRRADRRVRIPMRPGVDSLNVAVAAAVAFHRLVPPVP